jgi:DNA-binding LacI/PurR family transcriptional regulator
MFSLLLGAVWMDSSENKAGKKSEAIRPTVRDIARLAGVSQSTVSRILARDPSQFFSQQTRQRVLDIASDLGYSPNPIARALRGKQTQLIGLIIRGIFDPFFASLISEISMQARASGYQTVLGYAESDPNEVLQVSSVLDTRQTDGVIILGDWWDDEQAIQEILSGRRAVVAMCRGESHAEVKTVNTDNRAGIRSLLNHLTGLGHCRFGFLQGTWMGDFDERRESFLEYLQVKGIMPNPDWLIHDTDEAAGGYRAMRNLLELEDRPTAVLVADDLMAIGALKAASDAGVRVPNEISITGFDGIELTRFVCPALTTVRQPIETMTRIAIEGLLTQIRGESISSPRLVRVQPELIVRESTGSVNQTPTERRLPKE